ncbi:MAG: hypothetical protein ACO2PM_18905 [Pyrobaculum sp.]|jgi:hypothetical protein
MKIKEFLRGPLPDNVLKELEAKFGGPLTRLYVVGFKKRHVNPDGKAEEVLKRYRLLAQGGAVRPCTAGYNVAEDRWIGPPVPAVGRYVDVASSDAIFVGAPKRCKAAGAEPKAIDMIRLDVDFKAPRFVVRRAGGKVQVVDRGSGVILKEFPEKEYSVKAAAKALGVPPDELSWAEQWGEDGGAVLAAAVETRLRFIARRAAKKNLDFRIMLSGAKGFHVLLTLERPVPAEWRPAIAQKLAEWLDIEADPATFDPSRKLRVPWTVHTETGRLAVFVDPKTLEPVEFDWPRPIPYALAKTLAAFAVADSLKLAPRGRPKAERRRVGWMSYLEAVAAANPGLKEDCRKRFSALFGCACAADAVSVETCAERLAAALGTAELPHAYAAAMERAYETCARRIAEGQKPLFSIKRALTLDVGEGEGKVWYSIRECITALPRFRGEQGAAEAPAPPAAEEEQVGEEALPVEGQEAAPPSGGEAQPEPEAGEHASADEPQEEAAGGGEEAWEELERFIRERLLGSHV